MGNNAEECGFQFLVESLRLSIGLGVVARTEVDLPT